MKKLMGFAVVLSLVGGMPVASAQQGDAKVGKAIYDKSCANCHGADGTPKEAIAKLVKVEISHLGDAKVQGKTDADLKKVVLEGTGKMKPAKGVSEADAANAIAYVRTLKK